MAQRPNAACSSPATYDRLSSWRSKRPFVSAPILKTWTLATHSLVRVEQPYVISRDEDVDVTVCSGSILELPPGAERAFWWGTPHRFEDIEYAAQAAAMEAGASTRSKAQSRSSTSWPPRSTAGCRRSSVRLWAATENCVAQAYRGKMDEIREIASHRQRPTRPT